MGSEQREAARLGTWRLSSSPTAAWARNCCAAPAPRRRRSGRREGATDEPDLVRDLHADFIRAGARVITVNTYAATPERLAREGVGEMFEPLQKAGIDLAEQAREAVGTDCAIAGCLPPLFGSYQPELAIRN